MNQNYDPTRQQQTGNQWSPPPGTLPQPPPGGFATNQMNNALWADRALAALIDVGVALAFMVVLYIVLFALSFIVTAIFGAAGEATGNKDVGAIGGFFGCGGCFLALVLPPVSYFIIGLLNKVYWVSKRGYSIGQGVMKLKVVDKSGNFLSMGAAGLRLLCQVVIGFIPLGGIIDLLFPLFDEPTRQTLHDKAVGTYVIKTQ
ncbi:MAG TPA: RDD family protein [Pyrinomonadaceae bacterium]|nr:RDD family protein [Pyrinomonadaceae bacterium]